MFGTNCHFFPLALATVLTVFGCVNISILGRTIAYEFAATMDVIRRRA